MKGKKVELAEIPVEWVNKVFVILDNDGSQIASGIIKPL